jgi:hypothetical protein
LLVLVWVLLVTQMLVSQGLLRRGWVQIQLDVLNSIPRSLSSHHLNQYA